MVREKHRQEEKEEEEEEEEDTVGDDVQRAELTDKNWTVGGRDDGAETAAEGVAVATAPATAPTQHMTNEVVLYSIDSEIQLQLIRLLINN